MSADARRGTTSRAWRRLSLPLLIAAAMLILLGQASGGADGPTTHPKSVASRAAPQPCESVRVGLCRTLALPSGRTIRYAVIRPDGAATGTGPTPTVIVDQGGPGTAAFAANWVGDSLHLQLPAHLRSKALLVLEEPWVTSEYPEPCQQALTAFFRWAHDGVEGPAPDVAQRCQLWTGAGQWGWTPALYQQAVAAIERVESLRVDGFIGMSFGARRLGYLTSTKPRWAILVNPAPRAGLAVGYIRGRRESAVRSLAERCEACPQMDRILEALRAQSARLRVKPIRSPGRSVPITVTDLGAAFFGLGYQPAARVPVLLHAMLADPLEGTADIGGLADGVWSRFGVDSISPSYAAYLSEVCPAYPGWQARASGAASALEGFLTSYHAACAQAPASAFVTYRPPPLGFTDVCVSGTAGDPIAPRGADQSWGRGSHVIVLPPRAGNQHGDVAGVSDCAAALTSRLHNA